MTPAPKATIRPLTRRQLTFRARSLPASPSARACASPRGCAAIANARAPSTTRRARAFLAPGAHLWQGFLLSCPTLLERAAKRAPRERNQRSRAAGQIRDRAGRAQPSRTRLDRGPSRSYELGAICPPVRWSSVERGLCPPRLPRSGSCARDSIDDSGVTGRVDRAWALSVYVPPTADAAATKQGAAGRRLCWRGGAGHLGTYLLISHQTFQLWTYVRAGRTRKLQTLHHIKLPIY